VIYIQGISEGFGATSWAEASNRFRVEGDWFKGSPKNEVWKKVAFGNGSRVGGQVCAVQVCSGSAFYVFAESASAVPTSMQRGGVWTFLNSKTGLIKTKYDEEAKQRNLLLLAIKNQRFLIANGADPTEEHVPCKLSKNFICLPEASPAHLNTYEPYEGFCMCAVFQHNNAMMPPNTVFLVHAEPSKRNYVR
jgi:hypothetical protein